MTRTRTADVNVRAAERQVRVEVVHDLASLRQHESALEELGAAAVDPNVFYEPWMLFPAVEAFGNDVDFLFVLAYASQSGPGERRQLTGFFPLVRKRGYRRVPVRHLCLWEYKYCSLCDPPLRSESARPTVSAVLDWLATMSGQSSVMECRYTSGDGQFRRVLGEILAERKATIETVDAFVRPAFRPAADGDSYLKAALSGEYRRQMRRKAERLAECGRVDYTTLDASGDVEHWLDSFLRLEASGWKGREGSALASTAVDRSFFLEIAREAFRRNRLIMQSLDLDGEPIAQYCAFKAGAGSFDFKPAYDERYARYSPGSLLELERLRFLHSQTELSWMDSCSAPDSYRNRIWRERRTIESLLLSAGGWKGDLFVSTIHQLRRSKRARTVATFLANRLSWT